MSKVLVCTTTVNEHGECLTPLEWMEFAAVNNLSYSEFLSYAPEIFGVLLGVWGFKHLVRLIFNR